MFVHPPEDYKRHSLRVWTVVLLLTFAALGFAACGDDGEGEATSSTSAVEGDADSEDLQVIEDWSTTLSEGDVEGAAGYFALPSTATNGPIAIEIETLEDAIAFNETLPCGAEVVSATTTGERTTADFTLSERPGGGCGEGTGGTASTAFVIEDGKIVEWERVIGESEPRAGPTDAPEV